MSESTPAKRIRTHSEESNFVLLFSEVLRYVREKNKSITDEDLETAIVEIKASFIKQPPGQGGNFLTLDLNNIEILFGYLCRYGPLGAGLVRHRILDAIKKCPKFQARLKSLESGEVNGLSLGGGPGNDIIGFCSALHEYVCYRNLNLFVADAIKRWASCLNIVEFLVRVENFGNVTELFWKNNVSTSFICVDLPGDKEKDIKYFRALKESDIIIMAKLLSIVPEDQQLPLMKLTIGGMKPGALLLFIDSPLKESYFTGLSKIYTSESPDYELSETSTEIRHQIANKSKCQIVVAHKKSCNFLEKKPSTSHSETS